MHHIQAFEEYKNMIHGYVIRIGLDTTTSDIVEWHYEIGLWVKPL